MVKVFNVENFFKEEKHEANPYKYNGYYFTREKPKSHINQLIMENFLTNTRDQNSITESIVTYKEFRCFDCPHCWHLKDVEVVKPKNDADAPNYERYEKDDTFINDKVMILKDSKSTDYSCPQGLLTSIVHLSNFSHMYSSGMLEELHNIAIENPKYLIINDGNLSNDIFHFNARVVLNQLKEVKRAYKVIKEYKSITISVNEKGPFVGLTIVITNSDDINGMSHYLSTIHHHLRENNIFESYNMTTVISSRGDNFVVELYLVSKNHPSSYKILPGILAVQTTGEDPASKEINSFMFKNWEHVVKNANKTIYDTDMRDYSDYEKLNLYFSNMSNNIDKKLIIKIYDSIYEEKEKILTEDFYNRNKYHIFGIYKMIMTYIFLTVNTESELYRELYLNEISYKQKLMGVYLNASIFMGPPVSDVMVGNGEKVRSIDLMEMKNHFGEKSNSGRPVSTVYTNKYDDGDIGNVVVKFTTYIKEIALEYQNGIEINKMRKYCPHFMFTYDAFACNRDVVINSPKNGESVVSIDFKSSDKPCSVTTDRPMCPISKSGYLIEDELKFKKENCVLNAGYIVVELVSNPIPLSQYTRDLKFNNTDDIYKYCSLFCQISLALQMGQEKIGFVHGDLHDNNILAISNPTLGNSVYSVSRYYTKWGMYDIPIYDAVPVIIDFGKSRTDKTAKTFGKNINEDTKKSFVYNDSSDALSLMNATIVASEQVHKTNKNIDFYKLLVSLTDGYELKSEDYVFVKRIYKGVNKELFEELYSRLPSVNSKKKIKYVWGTKVPEGIDIGLQV